MVICGGTYEQNYTLLHTHYARAFHGVLYRQIIIQAGKAGKVKVLVLCDVQNKTSVMLSIRPQHTYINTLTCMWVCSHVRYQCLEKPDQTLH